MIVYGIHKNPSLHYILRHLNPIRIFTPYFSNIHFNIIVPYTCTEICMHFLSPHACYIFRPLKPPWFDPPNFFC
jgi:hypothetical protein